MVTAVRSKEDRTDIESESWRELSLEEIQGSKGT